jgi:hypothetical protein
MVFYNKLTILSTSVIVVDDSKISLLVIILVQTWFFLCEYFPLFIQMNEYANNLNAKIIGRRFWMNIISIRTDFLLLLYFPFSLLMSYSNSASVLRPLYIQYSNLENSPCVFLIY